MINIDNWRTARPLIERALVYSGGTHRAEDILDMCLSGKAQLWLGEKSAVVTEINVYPELNACRIFLAAGDKRELRDRLRPQIELWAKNRQNCTRMEIVGRRGWKRVLAPVGYTETSTVVTKELSDG